MYGSVPMFVCFSMSVLVCVSLSVPGFLCSSVAVCAPKRVCVTFCLYACSGVFLFVSVFCVCFCLSVYLSVLYSEVFAVPESRISAEPYEVLYCTS